jgi:hypothetical protein
MLRLRYPVRWAMASVVVLVAAAIPRFVCRAAAGESRTSSNDLRESDPKSLYTFASQNFARARDPAHPGFSTAETMLLIGAQRGGAVICSDDAGACPDGKLGRCPKPDMDLQLPASSVCWDSSKEAVNPGSEPLPYYPIILVTIILSGTSS